MLGPGFARIYLVYRKGVENTNVDSLSRNPISMSHSVTATSSQPVTTDVQLAQLKDPVVKQLHSGSSLASKPVITDGTQPLLKWYLQIWEQLSMYVVCRTYTPCLHSSRLLYRYSHFHCESHDIPTAGHQDIAEILQRLQRSAYWVGMAQDVVKYCKQCSVCQQAKLPASTPAPLTNVRIGGPW